MGSMPGQPGKGLVEDLVRFADVNLLQRKVLAERRERDTVHFFPGEVEQDFFQSLRGEIPQGPDQDPLDAGGFRTFREMSALENRLSFFDEFLPRLLIVRPITFSEQKSRYQPVGSIRQVHLDAPDGSTEVRSLISQEDLKRCRLRSTVFFYGLV